jgi:signal peptidase I
VSAVPHSDTLSAAYARAWRARTRRWTLRRLARIVVHAFAGFALAIAAAATLPTLFGFQSFAVLSGSMEPAIGTGDVVVVQKIAPLDAKIGDVVTFRSPEDPGKLVTHRATSIEASGETVTFVTKGDANTGVERWSIAAGGTIGKVEYRIPKLGYVTNRIGSRFGRFAFLVLPALVLLVSELRRIWRTEPKGDGDADRE